MSKRVIDFRSDTLTEPDAEMRKVMAEAKVGDDVWGEDPTVMELENYVAQLLGKEKALFVPSGTMSNLIATTVHCQGLFSEVIMGHDSHTFRYEVGGSVVARGHSRQLETAPDGTIPLDALRAAIQKPDVHNTITRVIYLENTHNARGGKVLPIAYLEAVRALADEHQVKMHCDGARIWNAATALKVPVGTLAKPFDTISVCCSKGLGAPIGSLLCGPADFIRQAHHARKMYGGGMRQVGIIAAAALHAVKHMYARLEQDHAWCRQMATEIEKMGLQVIKPDSNILIWHVAAEKRAAFIERCKEKGLLVGAMGPTTNVRAIPHYGNTDEDITRAIEIIAEVNREFFA
jgi:threonine aldolase